MHYFFKFKGENNFFLQKKMCQFGNKQKKEINYVL